MKAKFWLYSKRSSLRLAITPIVIIAACGNPVEEGDATLASVGLSDTSRVQPGVRTVAAIEAERDLGYEVVSTTDGVEAEFLERDCGRGEYGFCSTFEVKTDRQAPEGDAVVGIRVTDDEGRQNLLDYKFIIDKTPLDDQD